MDTPLEILLESALFFNGGSLTVKELVAITKHTQEEVEEALHSLQVSLEGRGVRLVRERDTASLATASEAHEMIEIMRREELEGPLGKAGLETLAIVMYKNPISRSDIEYIRGVNCSTILRSLMIRGLIERIEHPTDKRTFLYQATPELPAYLGVDSLSKLPGFAEARVEIDRVIQEKDAIVKSEETHE